MRRIRDASIGAARSVALSAILVAGTGCVTKNGTVSQAKKSENARSGIAETRAIAEAGFICRLPIVMNHAVMSEYAGDHNSGQFKAPFNQIKNEARVYTHEDTAVITPNSDTPNSFAWLDLPAVDQDRYYPVILEDGNTFVYGYIGSRVTGNQAGDYKLAGPEWKDEKPSGVK